MTKRTEKNLQKTAKRLDLDISQMPRNVAIIMDGNGRWAKHRGLPRAEGHCQGGKTVEKIALDCVDIGFEALTLYSFSTENWKRPKDEVDALMGLYTQYLVGIRPMMMKNHVKLLHLGRLEGLPEILKTELANSIEMTADNDGLMLGFAINYSGRTEIEDAIKKISIECKAGKLSTEDINEQCISEHLYAPAIGEPDLLIRTANERRISNFLLWQISYSEFHITETLWPDFTKQNLEDAILAYAKRNRRFGNIDSEVTAG